VSLPGPLPQHLKDGTIDVLEGLLPRDAQRDYITEQ
jgi:hypothetical protein